MLKFLRVNLKFIVELVGENFGFILFWFGVGVLVNCLIVFNNVVEIGVDKYLIVVGDFGWGKNRG